jgi:thioredoxin 1
MAGNGVFHVGDQDFQSQVLSSQEPVLVDFWATWCAPCRAIAPVIEELARDYQGKVRFAKVNVDENQDTAEKFGIRAMPTFLLFKGGQVIDQLVGAQPKARLNDLIKKAV